MTADGGDAGTVRPRALLILSGGGFTFETRCLLESLRDQMEFTYLLTRAGGVPGEEGIPPGPAIPVPNFASVTRPSRLQSLRAFRDTFLATRQAFRAGRVDAVIAVGCSHAVPMFLAARLAGRPTVYLESITRSDRLSLTGRLVRALRLASLFLVQWPGLAAESPHGRVGTVL